MADISALSCPNCGAPLSSRTDKVCKFCGAAIQITQNSTGGEIISHSDGIICPECGTLNKSDAMRCSNCRAKIQIACHNCGKSVYIAAPSCHYCGAPIDINANMQLEETIEFAIVQYERHKYPQAEKIFVLQEKEYEAFPEFFAYRLDNLAGWISMLGSDATMKSMREKINNQRTSIAARAKALFPGNPIISKY